MPRRERSPIRAIPALPDQSFYLHLWSLRNKGHHCCTGGMEPSHEAGARPSSPRAPSSSRTFRVGTAAYVLVVLLMLTLSQVRGEWALAAEVATLPIGLGWFAGGLLIVAAVAGELGWAGVPLLFGAFAASAVVNAVVLREVFRFFQQRRGNGNRSGPQRL